MWRGHKERGRVPGEPTPRLQGEADRLVGHCEDFGFYSGRNQEPALGFEQKRVAVRSLWQLGRQSTEGDNGKTQARWLAGEMVTRSSDFRCFYRQKEPCACHLRCLCLGPMKSLAQKSPMLLSGSAVAILTFLITFGQGSPFSLCTGPHELCTWARNPV